MDVFGLLQSGSCGHVVKFKGEEWITLYKVPIDNDNSKTHDFYIAVKTNEEMPAACVLIVVPRTQLLTELGTGTPADGTTVEDKPG